MKLRLELEFDDEKADAYNASLYAPEQGDPIQGDGRSLVRDLARDSCAELFQASEIWHELVLTRRLWLDEEELDLDRS